MATAVQLTQASGSHPVLVVATNQIVKVVPDGGTGSTLFLGSSNGINVLESPTDIYAAMVAADPT
jgi:hypothetical protein